MPDRMRLQKFLARAGVASRRSSEDLIREGRVRVDGEPVTRQGVVIDPLVNVVEVDGTRVRLAAGRWVMLNKPAAFLCTRADPRGRRTVYDLLDPDMKDLFHVGRLDFMSEGLLLLTNEGDLANALLHPRAAVLRRYEVRLSRPVPENTEERLRSGLELADGVARAESVRRLPGGGKRYLRLELGLREGRNREIRRMMDALGVRVRSLRRISFGPLQLGRLRPGLWRDLTQAEMDALRQLAEGRD